MKILLINKFHYMRGGSETYYFAQAEALKAKGHEVIFFAMQDDKNLPCDQKKYFVSNVDYNGDVGLKGKLSATVKFFYSFEAKKKMQQLIDEEKPDIAHIGLLHRQITFSVVDVLKKNNIPVVMTMHDLIFACPNYTMLSNGQNCEKCVGKSSIHCVKNKCIKGSTAKSLLASMEAGFLKTGKYYNKIDLYITECDFYHRLMDKSKVTTSRIVTRTNFLPINQSYEFSKNYEDYILYFGRFSQEKGIITLLKAHKQLECKYRLVVVGAGPIDNEIRQYIQDNNLKNIELPGPIYGEKMEEIVEKSRMVISPSEWYENCPYALLQSIAKGKIVIASRIGGLPELIKDNETGFLFKAGDEVDLADKIETVMAMNSQNYEAMSIHIAEEAKRNHYWEYYIDFLIEEYNSLIAQSK
ncbi:MAG: glycosyltransferase family 4 protein [Lachnospiraceae bacterium]|nr:glycosyltransferase family 4 protein [Lachnospiraceae bacterium]